MKVAYVVLYVHDPVACVRFWTDNVGMVEKSRQQAGTFPVVKVGFPDQDFAFELVPLELMKDNPDGLDLATPSIAFSVEDLDAARASLVSRGCRRPRSASTAGSPPSRSPTTRTAGSR